MIRTDIEVIIRKASITILTKDNQITFSPASEQVALFSTAEFTTPMLDELEKSKIVEVEEYAYSKESNAMIKINKRFGFSNEKFTDILTYVIEKYNL